MTQLLTKKDLAQRWQLTTQAIDNYIKEGIITPIKGIPSIRFNLKYIEQVEGCIPEKTTMRERRLERENESLREENEKLKGILANVLAETAKVINFNTN